MMKPNSIHTNIICLCLAAALLVSGCAGGANLGTSGGSTAAWIDQPRDGSSIPLAPISLIASVRGSADNPVTRIQFLVNGQDAGSANADNSQNPPQGQVDWTPPAPGKYTIQAVAFGADNRPAYSEFSHVCVGNADGCPVSAQGTAAQVAETPGPLTSTSTPAPTTGQPAGTVQFKTGADPAVVWFGKCDNRPTNVNIQAVVNDTSGAIEVDLMLALQDASGARHDAGLVSMQPQNGVYTASVDTNSLATGSLGNALILVYKVGLLDQNKSFYATSPEGQVQLLSCQADQPTTAPIQPPAATTEAPYVAPATFTPTFTPAPVIPTWTWTPVPPAAKKPTGYTSANQVFYINGCGPNTLTVFAQASDPSGVKQLRVHWVYLGGFKNPGTEKIFDMLPDGKGGYSLEIMDPSNHTAYPNLNGGNGQIQFWFEVTYGSGAHLISDSGYVTVTYCPG